MRSLNRRIFTGLILLLLTVPVFADYNTWGIPDSSEIRKGLKERWFEASLEDVRMNLPEIYDNAAGQKFQVRLEESDTTYMIFVAPCATINVKGPISQFYAIFKSGERVRIVFISGKALNVRFGKRAFDRIEIAYGEVRDDFLLL